MSAVVVDLNSNFKVGEPPVREEETAGDGGDDFGDASQSANVGAPNPTDS